MRPNETATASAVTTGGTRLAGRADAVAISIDVANEIGRAHV